MTKPGVEFGARLLKHLEATYSLGGLQEVIEEQAGRPVSSTKLRYLSKRESLCGKWLLQTLLGIAIKCGWEPHDSFDQECLRQTVDGVGGDIEEGDPVAHLLSLETNDPLVKKIRGYLDGQ